jgi:hypothetical protein
MFMQGGIYLNRGISIPQFGFLCVTCAICANYHVSTIGRFAQTPAALRAEVDKETAQSPMGGRY